MQELCYLNLPYQLLAVYGTTELRENKQEAAQGDNHVYSSARGMLIRKKQSDQRVAYCAAFSLNVWT